MLVNLTPHAICVRLANNELLTINPSGKVARLSITQEIVGVVDDIPIRCTVYVAIQDLPEPNDQIFYITSSLVGQVAKRIDVVSPDTVNGVERNSNGQVVAVSGFQTFA